MKRNRPVLFWDEISVSSLAEAYIAQQKAGNLANSLGMSDELCESARLITSELATNLAVHNTINGKIRISCADLGSALSLTIASLDEGPGITDIEEIFNGQRHSPRGLGAGLRTVKRYAHAMEICSTSSASRPCPLSAEHSFATIVTASLWQPKEMIDLLFSKNQALFAIGSSGLDHPKLNISLTCHGSYTLLTFGTKTQQEKIQKNSSRPNLAGWFVPVHGQPTKTALCSSQIELLFDATAFSLNITFCEDTQPFLLAKERSGAIQKILDHANHNNGIFKLQEFDEVLLIASSPYSRPLAELIHTINDVSRETILGEVLFSHLIKNKPGEPSALVIWKWTNT